MTANLTHSIPDFVNTLSQTALAFRGKIDEFPNAKVVTDALLQAEKATKQERKTFPLESLIGDWRLCFTAPRKAHLKGNVAIGKGFYVPRFIPAQISFHLPSSQSSNSLEIGNQIQLGSLLLRLTGPADYLGKKNLLAFDFTQMQLCIFNKTLYRGAFSRGKAQTEDFHEKSIAKLPFFAFFLITEEFIAARGRGGGLALWVKR